MASIGLGRIPTAGRLEVVPLANAASVVALAAYLICAALRVCHEITVSDTCELGRMR